MLTRAQTAWHVLAVLSVGVLGACGADSGGSSDGTLSSGAAQSAGAGQGERAGADTGTADGPAGPTTLPGNGRRLGHRPG